MYLHFQNLLFLFWMKQNSDILAKRSEAADRETFRSRGNKHDAAVLITAHSKSWKCKRETPEYAVLTDAIPADMKDKKNLYETRVANVW